MKVILESTTQTIELAHESKSGGVAHMPARIWQGNMTTLSHAALCAELREMINMLAREVANMHPTTIEAHRRAVDTVARRIANVVALVEADDVEVHAFITRIAHKTDERQEVFDRFARELQTHAAPRPEYERAYSLRMFI